MCLMCSVKAQQTDSVMFKKLNDVYITVTPAYNCFIVFQGKKSCIINSRGIPIIPFISEEILPGLPYQFVLKGTHKHAIIDTSGREIKIEDSLGTNNHTPKTSLNRFNDTLFAYNQSGKLLWKCLAREYEVINKKLIVITVNHLHALINYEGKLLTPLIYNQIVYDSVSKVILADNKILDLNGKTLINGLKDKPKKTNTGWWQVGENGNIYDDKFNLIFNSATYSSSYFVGDRYIRFLGKSNCEDQCIYDIVKKEYLNINFIGKIKDDIYIAWNKHTNNAYLINNNLAIGNLGPVNSVTVKQDGYLFVSKDTDRSVNRYPVAVETSDQNSIDTLPKLTSSQIEELNKKLNIHIITQYDYLDWVQNSNFLIGRDSGGTHILYNNIDKINKLETIKELRGRTIEDKWLIIILKDSIIVLDSTKIIYKTKGTDLPDWAAYGDDVGYSRRYPLILKNDDSMYFLSHTGNLLYNRGFAVNKFHILDGYAILYCDSSHHWGVIDIFGNTITPFIYDTLEQMNNENFDSSEYYNYLLGIKGKFALLNNNGYVIPPFLDYQTHSKNYRRLLSKPRDYYSSINASYYKYTPTEKAANNKVKMIVVNENEIEYDSYNSGNTTNPYFQFPCTPVYNDDDANFISLENREKIKQDATKTYLYDTINPSERYAVINDKGKVGIYDNEESEWIIPAAYNMIKKTSVGFVVWKVDEDSKKNSDSTYILNQYGVILNKFSGNFYPSNISHNMWGYNRDSNIYSPILNEKGDTILPEGYTDPFAQDNILSVKSIATNKYCIYDLKQKQLKETEFDEIEELISKYKFGVQLKKDKTKMYALISPYGKILTKAKYTEIEVGLYDELTEKTNFIAKRDNKWGVLDGNGKEISPFKYENEIEICKNGTIIFTEITNNDYKYGVANMKGKVLIPCIYDSISELDETTYEFRKDDERGELNMLGDIIQIYTRY